MMAKRFSKNRLKKAVFGCLFAIMGFLFGAFGVISASTPVYAVPNGTTTETVEVTTEAQEPQSENESDADSVENGKNSEEKDNCRKTLGAIGWLVCPSTGKIAEAVDWLYEKIESILVINPVEMKDGTPIYEIWKYAKGITNIVFIIFLLVVVISQLTGLGITNYGIKKALPKLIVAAVLVNLSFIICSLAVDVSNVIGNSVRGLFVSVEEATLNTASYAGSIKMSSVYNALADGTAVGLTALAVSIETGAIWMLIPTVLGAIVAVVVGLVTIAMRQAVVALLIMVAPLAIVAYMLPNTEQWFKKWKQLLTKMLVFYPMFSLLFGASSLAGWAIIASSRDMFGLILGIAVQIFPLFFSWSLMKMSGTVLGAINARLTGLMARPLAANRGWAESRREATRAKYLAANNVYTPSLRLRQYLSDRKIAREEELKEHQEVIKNRGLAYGAMRNYRDKDGKVLSREGESSYKNTIRNMRYGRIIDRHKNNFQEGVGELSGGDVERKKRLDALDNEIIRESDLASAEKARGENIQYRNAMSRHKRMEDAINAHFDAENDWRTDYKRHDIANRGDAERRYRDVLDIMNGNEQNAQYAAAYASQAYDTQKKIVESKMQKYFELTPPTRDVEKRLEEFTLNPDAAKNIDAIVAGLRILNQRGDTDLLKNQLDNLLSERLGGGITLGTHASQSLASFLMFEVKDNDPFLRRFGKYINLETAKAYNANERKVMGVTYDEYVKGYHDGETDLVNPDNPTGRMYAKKAMRQLVEGTSLDNIERTALANLDESLKKAYGYDKDHPERDWDVEGWLKKREEIQTAFEPQFLSASLKWLSGSEQINSGVKFWTGYEQKQKKEKIMVDGREIEKVITDEDGNPEYVLTPVWKSREFAGHEGEVEEYFRRKTHDYFKDQTTGQILGMRTDYRDATMEHLVEMFLEDSSEEESSDERKRKYEESRAEIQTRYGDMSTEEAQKLRAKDLKKLKMEMAGKQLRKILGETGKLAQIYRTRRSGAANNAKDWLRGWVGLEDEEELYKEVEFYEEKRKAQRMEEGASADDHEEIDDDLRVYNARERMRIKNELERIWNDSSRDMTAEEFYDVALDKIYEWFGEGSSQIEHEFKDFYEERREDSGLEAYTLKSKLEDLLQDPSKYPDA